MVPLQTFPALVKFLAFPLLVVLLVMLMLLAKVYRKN
jgi:hypothetical protein